MAKASSRAARRAPAWTAQQARQVINQWRDSGLSAAEFARQQGLREKRLYNWRKRLSSQARAHEAEPSASLIPVFVKSEPSRASGPAPVVVRLPSGVVLEVDSSAVAVEWVAQLLLQTHGA